jgi:hypothetical protein
MTVFFAAALVWWLWLIPRTLLQTPLLSVVISPRSLGECAPLDLLMLGNQDLPTSSGLVSQSLLKVAMMRDQSSVYYTTTPPSVQILNAVVTCQSLALTARRYSTSSVLVHYTCSGVACHQISHSIQRLNYVHLFSFVCKESVNLYTGWDYVPGYNVQIDRLTSNTISSASLAREGSCELCINYPSLIKHPRFHPASGCLGMLLLRVMLCTGTSCSIWLMHV